MATEIQALTIAGNAAEGIVVPELGITDGMTGAEAAAILNR